MVYNLFTFPITILFILNGFGQLYYAIKLYKSYPKQHNIWNSSVVFFLWILTGLLYPLFYSSDTQSIWFFQGLSLQIVCIYAPLLILAIIFYQFQVVLKRKPEIREERNIDNFIDKYEKVNKSKDTKKPYSLGTDLRRKAFHLIPAVVIIFLWIFAIYIWAGIFLADLYWGITGEEYAVFLILTVGLTGILIFAALDYIRLSFIFENRTMYHLMPNVINKLLLRTLKPGELYDFTKPVATVLAFVPIFFFPFGIFATAALIASLGDAAASLMGLRFGKHHFPKKSKKTIIGYVSGFIASFMTAIVVLSLFEPTIDLVKIITMAVGGASVFLIVDILSPRIDDNILNPIFSALVMGGILVFL